MHNVNYKKGYKSTNKKGHKKIPSKQKIEYDCISPRMDEQLKALSSNSKLIWSLNPKQILYIEAYYNYTVTPHIFKIQTLRRLPQSLNKAPSILKELRKGAREGRNYITKHLKKQDYAILDNLGISYSPVKYVITSTAVN